MNDIPQPTRRFLVLSQVIVAAVALPSGAVRAEDNTLTQINGATIDNGGADYVVGDTGTNNWLIVTNNGQLVNVAAGTIGNANTAHRNGAVVTGSGSTWQNSGNLVLGSRSKGNSLTITKDATVYCAALAVGGTIFNTQNDASSSNSVAVMNGRLYSTSGYIAALNRHVNDCNSVTVKGANSLWDMGGGSLIISDGCGDYNVLTVDAGGVVTNVNEVRIATCQNHRGSMNSLIVTNGGRFHNSGKIYVTQDNQRHTRHNKIIVSGSESLLQCGNSIYVPANITDANSMTVDDGGTVYTVGGYVGYYASQTNSVLLSGGGLWDAGTFLTVGHASGYNGVVTNRGGILQFTSASPTITINGPANGNAIFMNGGALSYRGIQSGTLPTLTDNWGATGVGAFTWLDDAGGNAFRLNNSYANNSLGRPYEFSGSLGPTNYTTLEFVDGVSGITGDGVNIRLDGSLLVLGAEARFQVPVTNYSANVTLSDAMIEAQAGFYNLGPPLTNFCSGYVSGGFQFDSATPAAIMPGLGLTLQNGVLSYRDVIFADVNAHLPGSPGANTSTNITLTGSLGNGFELNNAMTTDAQDQTYTFSAGMGSTHFAGLGMINGNTRYRNGPVTIASDGWLLISNTVATFDNAVTNLGTAQTYDSTVTYSDRFATSGSASNKVVNSVVNYNGGFFIIGSAGYTNWIVDGVLSGVGYTVRGVDLLGFATAGTWGHSTNNSTGFKIEAGGRMWVSNDSYTVFTVPLTNAGSVLVSPNAMLRTARIVNTGTITNDQGVFEFSSSTPDITTVAGGIVLANGGIGYYGTTDADVLANRASYAGANGTTAIDYLGNNYFQLNDADNRNDISQGYTFASGLGGTNFVGLRLIGNSAYHTLGGETVTFGSNGWLVLTNCTTSYIIGDTVSGVTYQFTDSSSSWNNGGRPLVIANGAASGNLLSVDAGLVNNVTTLTLGNTDGSANNMMVVTNGGRVYETAQAILGNDVGADNNAVTVAGGGSLWNIGNYLRVGLAGDNNSLTVTDGGTVNNTSSEIGYNVSADSNMVSVTGSGSLWKHSSTLRVGYNGVGNTLSITGGGAVSNTSVEIGYNTGSDNNAVTVSGSGSSWRNSSISVGRSGAGNSLTIDDGGSVFATTLKLGDNSGSDSNVLSVLDGGNLACSGLLTVGDDGNSDNNAVVASNAAVATVGLKIGTGTGANNTVSVLGTTVWDLKDGALTWGDGAGSGNNLVVDPTATVSNIGSLYLYNPGTDLTVSPYDSPLRFSGNGLNVGNGGSTPISLVVSNTVIGQRQGLSSIIGSACDNMSLSVIDSEWPQAPSSSGGSHDIIVGDGVAVGNVLTIDNTVVGETASPNHGLHNITVGDDAGASSNLLTICNGSRVYLLNDNPSVRVGDANGANYNRLVVSSGALLEISPACTRDDIVDVRIGNGMPAGTIGNAMIVDGGTYRNTDSGAEVTPGYNGSQNMLIVTNGGKVYCGASAIGQNAGCNDNWATVTGSGSLWDLGGTTLKVGLAGSTGNVVRVMDGGVVTNVNTLTVYTNNAAEAAGGILMADMLTLDGGRLEMLSGVAQFENIEFFGGGTVDFSGKSQGLLYVNTANRNEAAMTALVNGGDITVDGAVSTAEQFSITEIGSDPYSGYTEVKVNVDWYPGSVLILK